MLPRKETMLRKEMMLRKKKPEQKINLKKVESIKLLNKMTTVIIKEKF